MCLRLKIEELSLANTVEELLRAREFVMAEVNKEFCKKMNSFAMEGDYTEVLIEETLRAYHPIAACKEYDSAREQAMMAYKKEEIVLDAENLVETVCLPLRKGGRRC